MTASDIISSLQRVLLLDLGTASVFAVNAMELGYVDSKGVRRVDVKSFQKHDAIEHDASLTRSDARIGDYIKLNDTLYSQLTSLSSDSQHLTLNDLIKFRVLRESHSQTANPSYHLSSKGQLASYGEVTLLYLTMRDMNPPANGRVRIDWLDMLFKQEKFPVELGWRPTVLDLPDVFVMASKVKLGALALQAEIAAGKVKL
ncbi:hypothetical protein HDU76_009024 [Blyttiomyces sp. JEL0837]|nr:hypothetical protein HDU76_009024 [Blyttiomyces sp. JEL0837]